MRLPPLIETMRSPSFYPHRPTSVELLQTHISFVFLAESEVYKIKKPVRFSFLDFSTSALRKHFCNEEVRLNRRLAAEIYRGVVGIRRAGSTYALCAQEDSSAIEYAVHMRRIPQDKILTQQLDEGRVSGEQIDQLAQCLVTFHRKASHDDTVAANGAPEAIGSILQENFDAVRAFRDHTIPSADDDAIQEFSRGFLDRQGDLFRRRRKELRIREGHGDLHSEHVCLTNPPMFVDCIEFNERFRYCDVASDIAFLTMDLEYHQRRDLAARLGRRYAALADDPDLIRLLPFYQCYRAYVRGKVDSLTSLEDEIDPDERRAAESGARRRFALAYRYTWTTRRAVVVCCGMSGSGKSTLAAALADRTGFVPLGSDILRKELAGIPSNRFSPNESRARIYSAEHTARTYNELLARGDRCLADDQGVILDATFQRRTDRNAARQLAARHGVGILFVECRCFSDETRRRIAARAEGPSDADWEIYLAQRESFEPIASDAIPDHLALDTTRPLARLVGEVEQTLRQTINAD